MPFIEVKLIEGRSPEQKEKLIEELSKTASDVLNIRLEAIQVQLVETAPAHWGIAGKSVAKGKEENTEK